MNQESFVHNGRKYELTVTDPEILEEIQGFLHDEDITDEECCLLLGLLY